MWLVATLLVSADTWQLHVIESSLTAVKTKQTKAPLFKKLIVSRIVKQHLFSKVPKLSFSDLIAIHVVPVSFQELSYN